MADFTINPGQAPVDIGAGVTVAQNAVVNKTVDLAPFQYASRFVIHVKAGTLANGAQLRVRVLQQNPDGSQSPAGADQTLTVVNSFSRWELDGSKGLLWKNIVVEFREMSNAAGASVSGIVAYLYTFPGKP